MGDQGGRAEKSGKKAMGAHCQRRAAPEGAASHGGARSMDDEYIRIEMTREEWEQWTSNIATNAVKAAFGYGTLAPLVTVEDRCRERWPGVNARIRRRIRDVFVAIHLQQLGRYPGKLTGYRNGTIVVEREHLHLLDLALDRVKADVAARDSTPLLRSLES
jgi:hypothetical protein